MLELDWLAALKQGGEYEPSPIETSKADGNESSKQQPADSHVAFDTTELMESELQRFHDSCNDCSIQ